MILKAVKPKPAIVIPVYKSNLNHYEFASISRTFLTLGSYKIFILVPSLLANDIDHFIKNKLPGALYSLHIVEDHWLDCVASYNHLMLTPQFYNYYNNFTHILIAQLDSYVFNDQLIYWCLEPWAYIGAPIYPIGSKYGENNCQSIGCGGFSLRHIKSFQDAFVANPRIINYKVIYDVLSSYNWIGKLLKVFHVIVLILSADVKLLQKNNKVQSLLGLNEDVVFGKLLPQVFPYFKVPPYRVARLFALDKFIKEDLSLISGLPFGTHAWYSTFDNINAWSNWIPELKTIASKP